MDKKPNADSKTEKILEDFNKNIRELSSWERVKATDERRSIRPSEEGPEIKGIKKFVALRVYESSYNHPDLRSIQAAAAVKRDLIRIQNELEHSLIRVHRNLQLEVRQARSLKGLENV